MPKVVEAIGYADPGIRRRRSPRGIATVLLDSGCSNLHGEQVFGACRANAQVIGFKDDALAGIRGGWHESLDGVVEPVTREVKLVSHDRRRVPDDGGGGEDGVDVSG
jgi:hypothetical protein